CRVLFNLSPRPELPTLSLHDALPILQLERRQVRVDSLLTPFLESERGRLTGRIEREGVGWQRRPEPRHHEEEHEQDGHGRRASLMNFATSSRRSSRKASNAAASMPLAVSSIGRAMNGKTQSAMTLVSKCSAAMGRISPRAIASSISFARCSNAPRAC